MKEILDKSKFEAEDDYISYLAENGFITEGCRFCMLAYHFCEDAVKKYQEDDFIYDEPFSYMDGEEYFPVSCLMEWYGQEYIDKKLSEED